VSIKEGERRHRAEWAERDGVSETLHADGKGRMGAMVVVVKGMGGVVWSKSGSVGGIRWEETYTSTKSLPTPLR
jgi:hypothetical protein